MDLDEVLRRAKEKDEVKALATNIEDQDVVLVIKLPAGSNDPDYRLWAEDDVSPYTIVGLIEAFKSDLLAMRFDEEDEETA